MLEQGLGGKMDLESFSPDQMPEDAWEQRNKFADLFLDLMKEMKAKQVNEDITLNSVLIAILSYIYLETPDDPVFLKYVDYYARSLIQASEGWVEKRE
jgi:hypothetical protein